MVDEAARVAIARYDWWHTIEVAPDIVTPGRWDLRPTARRIPWPPDVRGLRCLDVGTMDGFWAFELERRGTAEVVALDLPGNGRRERFGVAARLLGSHAVYSEGDVRGLDPAVDGEFDLVFVGYVLQLVPDPLRALEAMRAVCRGHLIVLETVSAPLCLLPAPLARLDARRDGSEFFVFNLRGLRKAVELAGFEIQATTAVLADSPGPAVAAAPVPRRSRLLHAAGVRGRSAAVRAVPRSPSSG